MLNMQFDRPLKVDSYRRRGADLQPLFTRARNLSASVPSFITLEY